jgi:hypothetical protein
VTLNVGDEFASDAYYYTVSKIAPGASFTAPFYGDATTGQVVRFDLSHEGTVVAGLSHVKILEEFYPLLIALFFLLTATKTMGVIWQESNAVQLRLARRRRVSWSLRKFSGLKASNMAEVAATVLVFLPIYALSVRQYVPPWVTFFDSMMTNLFWWFVVFLMAALVLVYFDNKD